MSHDITIRENGQAEAVFAFKPAWHGLGTVIDHAPNSQEALELAGLDWRVGQEDLYRQTSPDIYHTPAEYAQVPNAVLNVREDTKSILGIVSENYKVVQNVDAFKFLDGLHQDGILKYETAFSLNGGKKIVITARLPKDDHVTDEDVLQRYVLFSNAHDGTEAIRFGATSVRVVCANTLALALSRNKIGSLSIRHSGNLDDKLTEARSILGVAGRQFDEFAENAVALRQRILSNAEWDEFLDLNVRIPSKFDPDYSDQRAANIIKTREAIDDLYHNDPKQRLAGIGETAWAAFNAVSEYVDHLPRRGKSERARTETRFNVTQNGTGNTLKQRAYQTALKFI